MSSGRCTVGTSRGIRVPPGVYVPREVRMWHVGNMNHNFFAKLNDYVMAKSKASMADETL
jgi:hypothetical protein